MLFIDSRIKKFICGEVDDINKIKNVINDIKFTYDKFTKLYKKMNHNTLHIYCVKRRGDIVRKILDSPSINHRLLFGTTNEEIMTTLNHVKHLDEIIHIKLVQHYNFYFNNDFLLYLAKNDNFDELEMIIKYGRYHIVNNLVCVDNDNDNVLSILCGKCKIDLICRILRLEFKLYKTIMQINNFGSTPLEVLLTRDIDISYKIRVIDLMLDNKWFSPSIIINMQQNQNMNKYKLTPYLIDYVYAKFKVNVNMMYNNTLKMHQSKIILSTNINCIKQKLLSNTKLSATEISILNNFDLPTFDDYECPICISNKTKVIFNCGHCCCHECCLKINKCCLCNTNIITRIICY